MNVFYRPEPKIWFAILKLVTPICFIFCQSGDSKKGENLSLMDKQITQMATLVIEFQDFYVRYQANIKLNWYFPKTLPLHDITS